MLIQRLITALILIPATLAILYFAPPWLFLFIVSAILLYGAWEWAAMMQVKSWVGKIAYLIIILLALVLLGCFAPQVVLGAAFVWWVLAFFLVLAYPGLSGWWGKGVTGRGLMGIFVLVPFWWGLIFIRSGEDWFLYLLFVLVLIWGADSAAYFVGKKWGSHKLAPLVSPGKSWEGCAGALASTLIIPVIAFSLCNAIFTPPKVPLSMWPAGIVLSFITVFFSIVGDLVESMIKRQAGVKDSGKLIPGHGGVLDRIDSLTAAIPVYAFSIWLYASYHS